ncbi:DUF3575 domain-containing protein [Subsaximicrobium wynnwilliamsii]|uniref:DUF3575 domain-containing protein n=2 Tax=Subsaximicrobium wynnwilliamsii TaxID=291179 RepID=A0A5C6ZI88_9FLAO|nr:DUF3575 domain-containing protein [Subsaximicrobium wynnwilliamsii]TXD89506.1 DUF3575 domain-containing protein [Subsaximicrobium wynnwilliamsii]TXE03618.1 DUF3575 domain-containing protein [Subsaximicrobium wynnwilliamsii]
MLSLALVTLAFAQNDSLQDPYKKDNEIKINALFLLLGAIEPSYERNLSESSSVGISMLITYDQENFDSDLNYYLSPYYRMFFGKKHAAGFFLEGFGMVISYDERQRYFTGSEFDPRLVIEEKNITNVALGFGLGGKWVTKDGFVFELNAGLGRNLINNSDSDVNQLVGKLGFNCGYRF